MKLLNVDTIEEVRKKLDQYFNGFESQIETAELGEARDRYLAREVSSDMDMPPFKRSVVDGYAVISSDTFGVSESVPVFLSLMGAVEMGQTADMEVKPGEAVYVPTGGMLPTGADAMVMIEYADRLDDDTIAVYKPAAPGAHVMDRGDDFREGQVFYNPGRQITVKDIGMLAAAGRHEVSVFSKPRAAILSTGDEIVDVEQIPEPGQIRDINSHTIGAFFEKAGGAVAAKKILPDDFEIYKKELKECLAQSDIVLLSGGSSAGTKDMTADVINSLGSPGVITHGIAIKPGKPTVIGVVREEGNSGYKLIAGLPGHPMSAIIVYKTVIEPFIKKYYFQNQEDPLSVTAQITENLHAGEGRETYQLVTLERDAAGRWQAVPIHAKSGAISQLMTADGYVKMEADAEGINKGDSVEVVLIL